MNFRGVIIGGIIFTIISLFIISLFKIEQLMLSAIIGFTFASIGVIIGQEYL